MSSRKTRKKVADIQTAAQVTTEHKKIITMTKKHSNGMLNELKTMKILKKVTKKDEKNLGENIFILIDEFLELSDNYIGELYDDYNYDDDDD